MEEAAFHEHDRGVGAGVRGLPFQDLHPAFGHRLVLAGEGVLQAVVAANERLRIRVLGLAIIADDVSPELALAAIESIDVLGALHASPAVRDALTARRG